MEAIQRAVEVLVSTPTSKAFFTLIGAMFSYVFGLQTQELWMVISILVVLDTSTGLLKARKQREKITSRRMADKLAAVAVYGIVIALVNALGNYCRCTSTQCPEFISSSMSFAAVFWVISTETKSIIENLSKLGYKLPAIIENNIQKYFGDKQ